MNNVLLDEQPLVVLPRLAVKIGLNEAILVQQMHYWLQKSTHYNDERRWIYNTHAEWQEQFPFWSISTIRRTIKSLEDMGIIVVGNYNRLKIDNTKWYSIDYEILEGLSRGLDRGLSRPPVQNEQTECSKWTDQQFNLNRPLPETTTEITTETTKPIKGKSEKVKYAEYVSMEKTDYDKLVAEHGELATKRMIKVLDNYKGANGKKYKDDYRAILNWVVERVTNEQPKGGIVNATTQPDIEEADWEKRFFSK